MRQSCLVLVDPNSFFSVIGVAIAKAHEFFNVVDILKNGHYLSCQCSHRPSREGILGVSLLSSQTMK